MLFQHCIKQKIQRSGRYISSTRCLSLVASNDSFFRGNALATEKLCNRQLHLHHASSLYGLKRDCLSDRTGMLARNSTVAADHSQDETLSNFVVRRRSGVRNVAIIAHVDHGTCYRKFDGTWLLLITLNSSLTFSEFCFT